MQIRRIALFAAIAATAACTTPAESDGGDAPGASAMQQTLQGDHAFEMRIDDSSIAIAASGSWIDDDGKTITLPLRGGSASISGDGERLSLDALELELGDLDVGSSTVAPAGGTLTNMRLILERPAMAHGSFDDATASASDSLDLRLEWTLNLPLGASVDLGSPEIADLPFDLTVARDPSGALGLDISIADEGELLALDDLVTVTALDADLTADVARAPQGEKAE